MTRPRLIIRSATDRRVVEVDDAPLTFGRHPGNRIAIPDDRMSRFHCAVTLENATLLVRDLGSRNGTHVNGQRIARPCPLQPGDVVRVGGIEILVDPAVDLHQVTPTESLQDPTPAADDAPTPAQARPAPPEQTELPIDPPRSTLVPAPEDAQPLEKLRHTIEQLDLGGTNASVALMSADGTPLHGSGGGTGDASTLLRMLLLLCARSRASDVHLEPKRGDYLVRLRVDGLLVEAMRLPTATGDRLTGVVKVLAQLDPTRKQQIQDGRFGATIDGRHVDYRVSLTPAVDGQKLVVRVLDTVNLPTRLSELGLTDWMHDALRSQMRQSTGMLISAGPTGSGKTTTLYAAIREIDAERRNVITIEDPPEYQIDGVTQMPINEQQGHTFSTLLRSVLRQDPDVLLVGEIRDAETARIALQASTTGHLVLTTIHARDGIGAIFRLLDLGVDRYLVGSALDLVLSQRLLRRLCEHCKSAVPLRPQESIRLGRLGDGLAHTYYASGCPRCLGTGYLGRVGVYELMQTTDELRDAILQTPSIEQLRKAIQMMLFHSVREAALRRVAEGVTSLEEAERVVGN